LAGDEHDVDAGGDEQRRVRVAEAVQAYALVAGKPGSSLGGVEGVGTRAVRTVADRHGAQHLTAGAPKVQDISISAIES
jgi:hypothetical protein